MLRTAIYMRVSTQDQSVESQRHELRRFIEARDDLVLIGEYEDVISGVTEKREQLDELMKAGRQRRIDAGLLRLHLHKCFAQPPRRGTTNNHTTGRIILAQREF